MYSCFSTINATTLLVLFASTPLRDAILSLTYQVFNLHRRYGPIRLPLLLQGWRVEARIGVIFICYYFLLL